MKAYQSIDEEHIKQLYSDLKKTYNKKATWIASRRALEHYGYFDYIESKKKKKEKPSNEQPTL